MRRIVPVILGGGSGSRLWPLSREEYPKHLIPLLGDTTLLQQTVLRLQGLKAAPPVIICNHQQRFMVAEQLQQIDVAPEMIALEPMGRNTAPAIAIAALYCQQQLHDDDLLLVLPADHVIQQTERFCETVKHAVPLAQAGHLVTFGVVPTHPHTGYGYIERGEAVADHAYQVQRFVEKPDLDTATQYLQQGGFDWNSGMFLFSVKSILQALQQYQPELLTPCEQALSQAQQDLDFVRLDADSFAQAPDISIDYAVMEESDQVVTLPLDAGWNDVGAWESLSEVLQKDDQGNVLQGDVLIEAVQNCYIRSESRLCAAIGVENLVVVETPDAILIADKDQTQLVKHVVQQLKQTGREERLHHRRQYRPWGYHELLIEQENFQVRRVMVKPGEHIAMQKHHLRSEHWVVIEGKAEILCEEKSMLLQPNESFYVPKSAPHEIRNSAPTPLVFIEVQLGECIKDDDVERLI